MHINVFFFLDLGIDLAHLLYTEKVYFMVHPMDNLSNLFHLYVCVCCFLFLWAT